MSISNKVYNKQFYRELSIRTINSAKKIYPIIKNVVLKNKENPTICDVGCGVGVWAKEFKDNGCKVLGVDGNSYTEELKISREEFIQHDLREPLEVDSKFDLAICLEVAEHLPEEMSDTIVKFLTSISDYILFSAAIPFQMGQGHINEQYQSYWIAKFRKKTLRLVIAFVRSYGMTNPLNFIIDKM